MAFEPIYDTVNVGCALPTVSAQTTVEVRFPLSDGTGSVLSATARAYTKRCDRVGNEIRCEGELCATLLCEGENGTFSLTQAVPFVHSVEADTEATYCVADMQVCGAEIISVTSREAKAAFDVKTDLYAQEKQELCGLSPQSSQIYTKQDKTPYVWCKAAGEKIVEVTDEVDNPFDSIFHTCARAVVTKRSAGPEVLTVEGETVVDAVGIKDGELVCKTFVTPFTEELGVDGARYGDTVCTEICVTDCKVLAENGTLALEMEMKLCYEVCSEGELAYVTDAYYVENELIVTEQTATVCTKKICETVMDRADGTIAIDDGPLCDRILCADGFFGEIASASAEDGSLAVDGVVKGSILYVGTDGKTYALPASVPFSFTFLLPCEADSTVFGSVKPISVTVRARRGNEIDVKADLALELTACKTASVCMVGEVLKGEERKKQTCAFSVYVGKSGDTLWEVARELGCAPEEITEQNEMAFPLVGGERVVLYRPLKV